jgi:hypothetical protein
MCVCVCDSKAENPKRFIISKIVKCIKGPSARLYIELHRCFKVLMNSDIVTLADDEDLRDVIRQSLNPLKITVNLGTGGKSSPRL